MRIRRSDRSGRAERSERKPLTTKDYKLEDPQASQLPKGLIKATKSTVSKAIQSLRGRGNNPKSPETAHFHHGLSGKAQKALEKATEQFPLLGDLTKGMGDE